MKKILLGLIVVIFALGAIFHKQILGTIDFYQYQKSNAETFAKAIIEWKQIPFTSGGSRGIAGNNLNFKSLSLPIPFNATKSTGEDASFAFGEDQSITVSYSNTAAELLLQDYSRSDESDAKMSCTLLSETSSRGACNSNYDFFWAFLEINKTDIHTFSSLEDKTIYNRLMTTRAETIPANTVSGFETKHVRGFIFTLENKDYVVELFDSTDQQYHLKLTNLDQGDMAYVLSNTTLSKQ